MELDYIQKPDICLDLFSEYHSEDMCGGKIKASLQTFLTFCILVTFSINFRSNEESKSQSYFCH